MTKDRDLEPVVITRGRLIELIRAERTLSALEAAGVDNWEWYGDALETIYKGPMPEVPE